VDKFPAAYNCNSFSCTGEIHPLPKSEIWQELNGSNLNRATTLDQNADAVVQRMIWPSAPSEVSRSLSASITAAWPRRDYDGLPNWAVRGVFPQL